MEVQTVVTVSDKEIRELVVEKARLAAGHDMGSSTIEFDVKDENGQSATINAKFEFIARVKFQKANKK